MLYVLFTKKVRAHFADLCRGRLYVECHATCTRNACRHPDTYRDYSIVS